MAALYDFNKCNVLINNEMAVGLGAGTPVTVAYNSDMITPYTGAKGEGAAAVTNDKSATLTLTLMQTSATNKTLHNLVGNKFQIVFVDSNDEGAVKATVVDAMVQTYAENGRGTEIGEREWTIFLPVLNYQV